MKESRRSNNLSSKRRSGSRQAYLVLSGKSIGFASFHCSQEKTMEAQAETGVKVKEQATTSVKR